ncbi:adenosine deaminase [Mycetocola zhujimingii]|uniref:Adenine deaminase n=1 Tax=Mycetocola zhujimingii TaxID=2079792 RepID=A0A2U1TAF8_9MICO|nr:adenosine deaminase [Mycetocola zhujimingii]PWC04675.1 adenosine deaminase [Mycetocola zhujimingii]
MKPLVELHVHIEGTLEPEMVFDLATRNNIALPYASVDALRELMEFDDLPSFLDLYYECCAVLRTREDFRDLMLAYLRRAAAAGVAHAEIFFDPQTHTLRGVPVDDVIDGLLDGIAAARDDLEVTAGLILCFLRDRPVAEAAATLESAAHRAGDLLSVGLDSAEVGYPPHLFAEVFERARELGLRTVAHAGEEGPAAYVSEALDVLRAERIDHGIRSLEDPVLVERLRREQTPLTICPFSNVRLRAVADLAGHPLKRMLDAGLNVSIHSDDPAYFGGYIDDNHREIEAALGLSASDLDTLATNAINSAFITDERRNELLG